MVLLMVATVNCYFNENSYYFSDDNKIFTHFCKKEDELWKAYQGYIRSYLVLLDMLSTLMRSEIKNVNIYHSSRLIEEVLGQIEPANEWGRSTVRYIHRNVLPYFVDYHFIKKDKDEIKKIINDGEMKVEAISNRPSLQDIKKRRIQKFKNGYAEKFQGKKMEKSL